MCRHVVENAKFNCGHHYPLRRQRVDCNRPWCTLSTSHEGRPHDHRQCATHMNPDVNLVMPEVSYQHPCNICLGQPPVPGNGMSGVRAGQDGAAHDSDDSDNSDEFSTEEEGGDGD
ncbi:hypothetical protein CERSUDRAFT_66110 [Gelatoporia subvermispora B]|uniref:CxC6 like cysteine cluster associated with KDZ domain-containing protein n=1 Tax=Ceriporiopsis subvermispora (strain B) TaxID=914234 RepID=M2RDM2_CERS8|nr:hypothetical protein CERSUDRAFT_66110 [Gelatoporia subvermispora B]